MTHHETAPGLAGQRMVFEAWRAMAAGGPMALRARLNPAAMIGELAHVSLLEREGECFRFRLAGGGIRQNFSREAKGLRIEDVVCCDGSAWSEGLKRAVNEGRPVMGRTRTADGQIHFWMRLPVSSDGRAIDQVLCHDRILPESALNDLDRAARMADMALRLDAVAA